MTRAGVLRAAVTHATMMKLALVAVLAAFPCAGMLPLSIFVVLAVCYFARRIGTFAAAISTPLTATSLSTVFNNTAMMLTIADLNGDGYKGEVGIPEQGTRPFGNDTMAFRLIAPSKLEYAIC